MLKFSGSTGLRTEVARHEREPTNQQNRSIADDPEDLLDSHLHAPECSSRSPVSNCIAVFRDWSIRISCDERASPATRTKSNCGAKEKPDWQQCDRAGGSCCPVTTSGWNRGSTSRWDAALSTKPG